MNDADKKIVKQKVDELAKLAEELEETLDDSGPTKAPSNSG